MKVNKFAIFDIKVYNYHMKVKKHTVFIIVLLSMFSSPLFAFIRKGDTMYITVNEIASKTKPSIWGRDSVMFNYGDAVNIIQTNGSWVEIELEDTNKKGWVKDSVLTKKKIRKQNNISVNAKELALAGKGFSSPVEEQYSKQYKKNFDIVDEMEKSSITIDKYFEIWAKEGRLRTSEE